MRPGIKTWNPLVAMALASGLAPVPLMEVFWGMGLARAVIAGARLGVFDALEQGPRPSKDLASSLGCAESSLVPLLNALTGFGYLSRSKGSYRLTRMTRRWLPKGSRGSLHEAMLMLGDLFAGVEPLEDAIRSGQVTNFHERGASAETWAHYIKGLGHFARSMGGAIAAMVPVDRPPKRLLDVAGGHGLYSAAMVRKHPELVAEVLDLPQAVEHGRALIAQEGLSERVLFREGDLRELEWGQGYDLVFLFNILHNLPEEACAKALHKARAALREGGTLVVVDSEHRGGEGGISAIAGFNELFFFLVSGSQAWPEAKVRTWLVEAGFHGLKRRGTLLLPGLMVLCARA